jgi:HD domain
MTPYDKNLAGDYLHHLAQYLETQPLKVTDDIKESNGTILISKNTSLTKEMLMQLYAKKLNAPVEAFIQPTEPLTGQLINDRLADFITQYEDLRYIHEQKKLDRPVKALCSLIDRYPLILHKLTILAKVLPTEFNKGCFSAWLSLAVAQGQKLSMKETEGLFIGGFAHDIGMLHLPPELLKEHKKYTPEEWKAMQQHTLIGHHICQLIPNLPPIVGEILLYHHETCDGTGYFSKQQHEVSNPPLIISLIDSLFAVRFKQLSGKTLFDLMPFLQSNQYVFGYNNYASIATILKRIKPVKEYKITQEQLISLCNDTQSKIEFLTRWLFFSDTLIEKLKSYEVVTTIRTCLTLHAHITQVLNNSGLASEGLQRWISHVKSTQFLEGGREIDELSTLCNEVLWQFKKLHRHFVLAEETASSLDFYKNEIKKRLPSFDALNKGVLVPIPDEQNPAPPEEPTEREISDH